MPDTDVHTRCGECGEVEEPQVMTTFALGRKILPHPGPLPLGEGPANGRGRLTEASAASAGPDHRGRAQGIFPLPAGEGRGEGERFLLPASSQIIEWPLVEMPSVPRNKGQTDATLGARAVPGSQRGSASPKVQFNFPLALRSEPLRAGDGSRSFRAGRHFVLAV